MANTKVGEFDHKDPKRHLDDAQYNGLTGGGDAGGLHTHADFAGGYMALSFGRPGSVVGGINQHLEHSGVPTNIAGPMMHKAGELVGVSVAVQTAVGPTTIFRVYTTDAVGSVTSQYDITLLGGERRKRLHTLSVGFNDGDEIKVLVLQGQADYPIVFAEVRWI